MPGRTPSAPRTTFSYFSLAAHSSWSQSLGSKSNSSPSRCTYTYRGKNLWEYNQVTRKRTLLDLYGLYTTLAVQASILTRQTEELSRNLRKQTGTRLRIYSQALHDQFSSRSLIRYYKPPTCLTRSKPNQTDQTIRLRPIRSQKNPPCRSRLVCVFSMDVEHY